MNKLLASAAILGVIAATSTVASAEDSAAKVKCSGIAKAGKNACKATDGSHSCAGQAKADNLATEWDFADSAEACTKAGGKVVEEAAAAAPATPAAAPAAEAPKAN